jgi:hypothetical protein
MVISRGIKQTYRVGKMLTASSPLAYRGVMAHPQQRSLWPLAAVVLAAIPLGLLIYYFSARRAAVNHGLPSSHELKPFEQPEGAKLSPAVEPSPEVAPAANVHPTLAIDEPPHLDHVVIAAEESRRLASEARELAEKHRRQKPGKPIPVVPSRAVELPPNQTNEPISIRPPAPEDEAAKIARETLTRACVALRRTHPGWLAKSYAADWQGTSIDSGRQLARVAFGGGKWPDCDVTMHFDKVRQKWKVISVQGGGFPAGWQW